MKLSKNSLLITLLIIGLVCITVAIFIYYNPLESKAISIVEKENIIDIRGTIWELDGVENLAEYQTEDFYYYAMNPLVFQHDYSIITQENNDSTYTYKKSGNSITILDEYGVVLDGFLVGGKLELEAIYEGRDANTILTYSNKTDTSNNQEIVENLSTLTNKTITDVGIESDLNTISLDFHEKIEEIEFLVPSLWRKVKATDGFYYYPYTNNSDAMLYLNYQDVNDFSNYDIYSKDNMTHIYDAIISGIESSSVDFEIISKSIDSLPDDHYYAFANYYFKSSNVKYDTQLFMYMTPTYFYSIGFTQPQKISKQFDDIFKKIIDSLKITISKNSGSEYDIPETTHVQTNVTTGQINALRMAKGYLDYSAFSKQGLIEQLKFEGFTSSEAEYGADNCDADWNEQAIKMAKDYLNYSAFSKQGLIDQLKFEGFTSSEAEYGADNCDADWNEQAIKMAKDYLSYSAFSKQGLIDQLKFEGFTSSEAEYGVINCGADW